MTETGLQAGDVFVGRSAAPWCVNKLLDRVLDGNICVEIRLASKFTCSTTCWQQTAATCVGACDGASPAGITWLHGARAAGHWKCLLSLLMSMLCCRLSNYEDALELSENMTTNEKY